MKNNTAFFTTYPLSGFLKQQIKDERGFVRLTISSKIRFKPMFYFYRGTELIYTAIINKSNLIRFKFDISNTKGKHIVTLIEKPTVEKKTIFREYSIEIGTEVFNVQYENLSRSFTIKNKLNQIVVQGKLVSPLIMNIFKFKKYKIDFYKDEFPEELWMAIVFGILTLE